MSVRYIVCIKYNWNPINMDMYFEVKKIGYVNADDSFAISFSAEQRKEDTHEYLLTLLRSTDAHEDIIGIEGVYVEWCEQLSSCYGCIKHFGIKRDQFVIEFDKKTEIMPETIVMTLYINDHEYHELLTHLRSKIFLNCNQFEYI